MKRSLILLTALLSALVSESQMFVRTGVSYSVNEVGILKIYDPASGQFFVPADKMQGRAMQVPLLLGWSFSDQMLDVSLGAEYMIGEFRQDTSTIRMNALAPIASVDMYFLNRDRLKIGAGISVRYSTVTFDQRYMVNDTLETTTETYPIRSTWNGMGYKLHVMAKYMLTEHHGIQLAVGAMADDRRLYQWAINGLNANVDGSARGQVLLIDGLDFRLAYTLFF